MRLETSPFKELAAAWPYLLRCINGGISFRDNLDAKQVSYTSNGVANTEDTVAHTLGRVPIGFIVVSVDKGATVYKSNAFTATALKLKCTQATTAVILYVI